VLLARGLLARVLLGRAGRGGEAVLAAVRRVGSGPAERTAVRDG
jgi:hypothetical protein